eukprot:3736912-Pleurochrysis_carterae.AAC.1
MATHGSRYREGERYEVRHLKLLSRAGASLAVECGRRHIAAQWLPSASMHLAKGRVAYRSKRRT